MTSKDFDEAIAALQVVVRRMRLTTRFIAVVLILAVIGLAATAYNVRHTSDINHRFVVSSCQSGQRLRQGIRDANNAFGDALVRLLVSPSNPRYAHIAEAVNEAEAAAAKLVPDRHC